VGSKCGFGAQARVISTELRNAAGPGKSKSVSAYGVCRKALELYLRESGLGGLFYIVNSRLRKVETIRRPSVDCYLEAVVKSCGDLADFIRLLWEGLNFEFPAVPRGELMLYRGVEVSEAA
jgi:hypothetical protein